TMRLYFTVNESFPYASTYVVKNFDACRLLLMEMLSCFLGILIMALSCIALTFGTSVSVIWRVSHKVYL
ncbi:MAG: hypothetical protein WBP88_09210, partial [Nitrososphaeraceae archaeon]